MSVVVDTYLSPCFFKTSSSTAVLINSSLKPIVAMLAFSIDFQSISFTEPEPRAWPKLYIALAASLALAPDSAATLATPWIAVTAESRSTPALVNLPMLLVMSEKL